MAEIFEKKVSTKSARMEELKRQLAELEITENDPETLTESVSSDDEVQAKPKRERTEKQKLAFEKAQQTRLLKAEERRKQREQQEAEAKKELEAKLIEKAIKVKKKQIKRAKVIEELSDDDTPIEKLKPRQAPRKEPMRIRFV